jgi:hypothetical protein
MGAVGAARTLCGCFSDLFDVGWAIGTSVRLLKAGKCDAQHHAESAMFSDSL